ncbi:MAG: PTS sugar transporter subunit IIC [Clostridiales Family XIII bacterium]|jgi:PTS system galactitol-specific IIC component|nr:PTS sugar transporter subunit IIC [Clostridiales Family XIII bacterium]
METIKLILDLFGASIFVPIIVFILSLVMRVPPGQALKGAIYMGIGLTAFNVLLGALTGQMGPIITEMVNNTGVNLPVLDIGWPAASVIVYANYIGLFFIPFGLAVDLLLYVTKWTDTFHPTDIWNYYFFVFWAAIIQLQTGSFALGIVAGVLLNLILLLLADWVAPAMECYYGYQGVVSTCYCSVSCVPIAVLIRWVFKKTGLNKIQLSPSMLRDKFGFWGEPVTMGLIIGLAVSVVAKISGLGVLDNWAIILKTAIMVGAMMAIYPAVSGLFVKGLIPITQTLNARMRSGQIKRKQMNIAIDPAVFFGEEANIATGLVLIPVMILFAIFLPGNTVLPLADLPALPFMMIGITCVVGGNALAGIVTGILWISIGFLMNSEVAPVFTDAAIAVGAVDESAGDSMVSSLIVGNNPIAWVVYKMFTLPGTLKYVGIAVCFAVYLVVYFLFRKNKKAWQLAAGGTEEYFAEKEAIWNAAQANANA